MGWSWYQTAADRTLGWLLTVAVCSILSFRLRRLWQPTTLWSRSWLRSCRTSGRELDTRSSRRRTKVTLLAPRLLAISSYSWWSRWAIVFPGKLDEKRAPEADLRWVGNVATHRWKVATHATALTISVLFSIFDDVGDYILSSSSSSKPPKDKDRHRERDRDREEDSKSRRHTYFEKPRGDEHQVFGFSLCSHGQIVLHNNRLSLFLSQVMEADTGNTFIG